MALTWVGGAGRRALCLTALSCVLALLAACQGNPKTPAPRSGAPVWTQAQAQAFRELGFTPTETGWELNLASSLLFEFDSERLTAQQQQNLQRVARTLSAVGVDGLRIEGHSDNVGVVDYNLRLSQRRAAVVAQVLAVSGMQADKLVVRGYGKDKPIADNGSEAGRAQNRRVVLIAPSM